MIVGRVGWDSITGNSKSCGKIVEQLEILVSRYSDSVFPGYFPAFCEILPTRLNAIDSAQSFRLWGNKVINWKYPFPIEGCAAIIRSDRRRAGFESEHSRTLQICVEVALARGKRETGQDLSGAAISDVLLCEGRFHTAFYRRLSEVRN